jgi:hypothetical protein
MRDLLPRLALAAAAASTAFATGGCLVTSTAPPYRPGMEKLPGANVAAREQVVLNQLAMIKRAEEFEYASSGSYATMEDLVASGHLTHSPQGLGYTIDLTLTDDGYEVLAVPVEYGPDGRRSFYLDQTGKIRGDDHNGGAPSADDPVVPPV